MKQAVLVMLWTALAAVVVWAAVSPQAGVIYQNPLACAGLGLIGLGLCLEAHRRQPAPAAVRA